VDKCLNCNENKRSLPYTDFEENDEVYFNDLTINQTDRKEFDLSHIRNVITAARTSSTNKTEDQFSLLENAIQQGNIDLAVKLIKQTQNYLERENDQGQTPLLLAGKFNQNRLIIAILKKRPELARHVDERGNNLLHLLASVQENKARETIETILMLLDNKMIKFLISGLNRRQQTPEQIAKKNGNLQYIDLWNRKVNSLDSDL
jgi:ankyrin repeat protein